MPTTLRKMSCEHQELDSTCIPTGCEEKVVGTVVVRLHQGAICAAFDQPYLMLAESGWGLYTYLIAKLLCLSGWWSEGKPNCTR